MKEEEICECGHDPLDEIFIDKKRKGRPITTGKVCVCGHVNHRMGKCDAIGCPCKKFELKK